MLLVPILTPSWSPLCVMRLCLPQLPMPAARQETVVTHFNEANGDVNQLEQ